MLHFEEISIWKKSPMRNTRFARENIEGAMRGIRIFTEIKAKLENPIPIKQKKVEIELPF